MAEYVKMGSIQLGEETDKHFVFDLLPENYEEIVYENDNFYACKCKNIESKYIGEEKWNELCETIEKEFGDNLMEIYSITSEGVYFVVYLKKEKND